MFLVETDHEASTHHSFQGLAQYVIDISCRFLEARFFMAFAWFHFLSFLFHHLSLFIIQPCVIYPFHVSIFLGGQFLRVFSCFTSTYFRPLLYGYIMM